MPHGIAAQEPGWPILSILFSLFLSMLHLFLRKKSEMFFKKIIYKCKTFLNLSYPLYQNVGIGPRFCERQFISQNRKKIESFKLFFSQNAFLNPSI
jgi:hypothetical protein